MNLSQIADLILLRTHLNSVVFGTSNISQTEARGFSALLSKIDRLLSEEMLAFDVDSLRTPVEDSNEGLEVVQPAAPKATSRIKRV